MTVTDKLIEQLRDEDSYYRIQEKHWCIDSEELERQRLAAADRIEQLTAEVERQRRLRDQYRAAWEAEKIRFTETMAALEGKQ
jgi:hypothetical protein